MRARADRFQLERGHQAEALALLHHGQLRGLRARLGRQRGGGHQRLRRRHLRLRLCAHRRKRLVHRRHALALGGLGRVQQRRLGGLGPLHLRPRHETNESGKGAWHNGGRSRGSKRGALAPETARHQTRAPSLLRLCPEGRGSPEIPASRTACSTSAAALASASSMATSRDFATRVSASLIAFIAALSARVLACAAPASAAAWASRAALASAWASV